MAPTPETTINVVTVDGAKLSLSAGDTLVVTLPHAPTMEQVERLTAHASKGLPDGVKVLVLGSGITIAAVSAQGGDSLMCEIKALRQEIKDLRREQHQAASVMVCA